MRYFVVRGSKGDCIVADFATRSEADTFASKCDGYRVVEIPNVIKVY